MVVLAHLTLYSTICVSLTGDLTPQGEEDSSQAHQTQEHRPGQGGQLLPTIVMLSRFLKGFKG